VAVLGLARPPAFDPNLGSATLAGWRAGTVTTLSPPTSTALPVLCASLLTGWAPRFLEVGASVLKAPTICRWPGHP
jgi:hypothetical protein